MGTSIVEHSRFVENVALPSPAVALYPFATAIGCYASGRSFC